MSLATEKGKAFALRKLAERRKANEGKKRIDNSKLHAGSPMYFYCISCGAEIVVPEDYINKSAICLECRAMKAIGWLE